MTTKDLDTRARIIKATVALIRAESDVAAISVRRIMAAADVNLNSVNYHFRSKENLIKEAVATIIGEFLARQPPAPATADPLRQLKHQVALPARFLAEEPHVSRISILSDLASPQENDLTLETTRAFLEPLRLLNPAWTESEVQQAASSITAWIQHVFLRADLFKRHAGLDFFNAADRERILDSLVERFVPNPKPRGRR